MWSLLDCQTLSEIWIGVDYTVPAAPNSEAAGLSNLLRPTEPVDNFRCRNRTPACHAQARRLRKLGTVTI